MADYPEHDKLRAVKKESQTVGEFIEWLNEHGYHICERREPLSTARGGIFDPPARESRHAESLGKAFVSLLEVVSDAACLYWPTTKRLPEALLAEFFEINQIKLEEEKWAMLDELQKHHEAKAT